uniref:Uncharacterized protein n=1 Tax=Gopherus evgoodei TaxID=1825980 RepID=A0A8C4YJL3_9SAUR
LGKSKLRSLGSIFMLIRLLTTASISEVLGGAKIVCTINLCLLFSFGS